MDTRNTMNTEEKHRLQIFAAVVIALIFILLFGIYAVIYLMTPLPAAVKFIFAGLMAAFIIAMIVILIQRVREIKKGENDDLSNY